MFLRLEILKKAAIALSILVTYRFGILAMVWGQCVSSFVCLGINTHYSGVMIDYPLRAQLRDLFPGLLLSVAMAGIVYLAGAGIAESLWLKLAVQFGLAVVI